MHFHCQLKQNMKVLMSLPLPKCQALLVAIIITVTHGQIFLIAYSASGVSGCEADDEDAAGELRQYRAKSSGILFGGSLVTG